MQAAQAAQAAQADQAAQAAQPKRPLISFAVPCYNMAEYLDRSVKSILAGTEDTSLIEIILVDDGSTKDDTGEKIDAWERLHPSYIRAIHQENAGHGGAVNTGLAVARGTYFKVLDADDWLDQEALGSLLARLKSLADKSILPDLVVTNYVYEKVEENTQKAVRFQNVLPEGRVFTWDEVKRFKPQQNLLMHTALYRTDLLRSIGLTLPNNTFYVDNIYVFIPLPAVGTLYYLNLDLYRYLIGREGQSVHEATMVSRIDQQLRITRIMLEAYQLQEIKPPQLSDYMSQYLLMMLTICTVFLRLSDLPNKEGLRKGIWQSLKEHDLKTYYRLRGSALGLLANLPGKCGEALAIGGYRISQRLFPFN
ncbi:MAG: glycosyltransferase family 2 protein [Coriobacteriia bacterium]|nr:glycosyltransferase family 2 protein [Coriobacteriia bacterium]